MQLKYLLTTSALTLIACGALAKDIVPSESEYYYAIGGGSNIDLPAPTQQHSLKVGGHVNGGIEFDCINFNPSVSIKNSMNNFTDSAQALTKDVVSNLTTAIGAFALQTLAKANPEVYNIIQNGIAGAENDFNLSMKDCEAAKENIADGTSPFEDWYKISDSQGWLNYSSAAKEGQSVDIVNGKKEMAQNKRKDGIPWVNEHKNAGGKEGQKPIKVIYDVVVAGYNVYVDPHRALDDESYVYDNNVDLIRYWKSPKEAGEWARLVLGDITISANENNKNTDSGMGLVSLLRNCPDVANNDFTCAQKVATNLIKVIQGRERPTTDELEALNTGNMLITPDIIATIANMPESQKRITIGKLAEDIAIQNLVDEALMLRRVLIAGSQTKPVQNLQAALNAIQKTIEHLDQDIKNLTYELEVKEKLSVKTMRAIMNSSSVSKTHAMHNQAQTKAPSIEKGAVYKKQGA